MLTTGEWTRGTGNPPAVKGGPELSLGVSRQNVRRKLKCRMNNQHLAWWQGLSSTRDRIEN
jgi:hypothetical protein